MKTSKDYEQEFLSDVKDKTSTDINSWMKILKGTSLTKMKETIEWLKKEKGLNHLQATLLTGIFLNDGKPVYSEEENLLNSLFKGKDAFIPLYEELEKHVKSEFSNIQIVPTKTYSLRIINHLFEIRTLKFTIHIEPYGRMLNLLIHYELGNTKLLHYLIPSTVKYLKSKNKLFKVESAVLKFLKNAARLNSNDEIQKSFLLLKDDLELLKKDSYEKNAFVYFDFLDWGNKKIIQLNV